MLYVYIVVTSPPASVEDVRDLGSVPWRRAWPPTPVFLPWTEEPGGLKSMESHRVGHD